MTNLNPKSSKIVNCHTTDKRRRDIQRTTNETMPSEYSNNDTIFALNSIISQNDWCVWLDGMLMFRYLVIMSSLVFCGGTFIWRRLNQKWNIKFDAMIFRKRNIIITMTFASEPTYTIKYTFSIHSIWMQSVWLIVGASHSHTIIIIIIIQLFWLFQSAISNGWHVFWMDDDGE